MSDNESVKPKILDISNTMNDFDPKQNIFFPFSFVLGGIDSIGIMGFEPDEQIHIKKEHIKLFITRLTQLHQKEFQL